MKKSKSNWSNYNAFIPLIGEGLRTWPVLGGGITNDLDLALAFMSTIYSSYFEIKLQPIEGGYNLSTFCGWLLCSIFYILNR